MSPVLEALRPAAAPAAEAALPVPASVTPQQAWALFGSGQALLVDVRTPEELTFVGQVPGSINVPWATGTSLTRNPRFLRELESRVPDKGRRVLLLCRSGQRSALALQVAQKAGYTNISNISEGFEGTLDADGHRGRLDGWRFHGLPWTQN